MHIDTLSIARDLKAAELPTEQAEAIATAIGRSVTEGTASKNDVQLLRAEVQAVEERLTARIEAASRQTMIWLASAIFATAGILLAAIKL